MADAESGRPIFYEALAMRTPVFAASGVELGTVAHVLAEEPLDPFDGIVVNTHDGIRFIDRDQIDTIRTAPVTTTLSDEPLAALPKPAGDQIYEVNALQGIGPTLTAHLGKLFGREH